MQIKTFISDKVFNRIKQDKKISLNIKRFQNEIEIIVKEIQEFGMVKNRTEKIGEFIISPKHHHNPFRIAWHQSKDKNNQLIYIDDILYHSTDKHYIGNWDKKAKKHQIKISDYKGFKENTQLKNLRLIT